MIGTPSFVASLRSCSDTIRCVLYMRDQQIIVSCADIITFSGCVNITGEQENAISGPGSGTNWSCTLTARFRRRSTRLDAS